MNQDQPVDRFLPPEIINAMINDRKIRTAITYKSHFLFFSFYFSHYVKYKTAPFQREFFSITENDNIKKAFIVAFRGSAKSSIFTMSYPLWAILGKQQKKFILILCQTMVQAKQHMMNLRRELENNTLLKNDLGPFQEENNEWGSSSLVFSNSNARITTASTEQSVRGLRHNQHRPDLIIGDDLDNLASTKTRESRNKTYQWLTGEVIPAGDKDTRMVLIGNLLHEDSLLMRIKEDIKAEKIDGVFREYPLIHQNKIMWPGKYLTMADVEEEKRKLGNDFAWEREFMLRIIPSDEQAIHKEWIQYWDELPDRNKRDDYGYRFRYGVRIGVDLAISQTESADYTAMVPAVLYNDGGDTEMYILPGIINRKITFPETVELCKDLNQIYKKDIGSDPEFIIEDVAYQRSLPQQLKQEGIWNVKTTRPGNQDKRTRLVLTANIIKTGRIKFPRKGAEELISQIVHFGSEKHDDLADAFSSLVISVTESPPVSVRLIFI
jgi:predicted phage terminase large subunit-like protein